MPTVAAALYVQSILQGLKPPGKTGVRAPINAYITPIDPDVNPDGVARCYVWAAEGKEHRRAGPRNRSGIVTAGWKEIHHDIHVMMVYLESLNDPPRDTPTSGSDVNFPALIDFVAATLGSVPTITSFTDPMTGNLSQFANLGETMRRRYVPPRSVEPQRMRRYDAEIIATLLEMFQF